MAWTGIIDGKCLPVVWFQGSVNGEVYLELLKNNLWHSVKSLATRRQYWYQQDGTTCHVTKPCMDFLKSKFGHQILSRGDTPHHWAANSPDLSPMDFRFLNHASDHLRKTKPQTIRDMKRGVESFAENLGETAIHKMGRHARKRALACLAAGGGHFEHLM